jgi:hypothetical protein
LLFLAHVLHVPTKAMLLCCFQHAMENVFVVADVTDCCLGYETMPPTAPYS